VDRERLLQAAKRALQAGAHEDLLEQAQSVYKGILDGADLEPAG
jgi:hypothetical protein